MNRRTLAAQRLRAQRLSGPPFQDPADVVGWLGAVQAQDYHGAKWGVAQRTTGATDADLDRLFDTGAILRTHAMRPTWHFVRPEDIRWLQALTAPRVHARNAPQYRRLELDGAVLARSHALIAAALAGGAHRTRAELGDALEAGGVPARGQRLAYIVMHAELEALVVSGPRRGRQFTYALLDARVPESLFRPSGTPALARDEALATLTRRYFASHGPATVADYRWWSGLTAADARAGIEAVQGDLVKETMDGKTYWRAASSPPPRADTPVVHLLPNYDEHVVAYRDHGPSLDPQAPHALAGWGTGLTAHQVVRDGLVVGGWRRRVQQRQATVTAEVLVPLDAAERAALAGAAEAYGRFLGLPVTVEARA